MALSEELRSLYQEVILDHYKHPHNFGPLEPHDHKAEGYNPLCGDAVSVYVRVNDGIVEGVSFEGQGCAISTASASLMTEAVKGKTFAEAEAIFDGFRKLVTGQDASDIDLGKLEILGGVRDYPVRIKCAILAWHALHSALAQGGEAVTTE
jgi:nitrogen fixation NifU-like protein